MRVMFWRGKRKYVPPRQPSYLALQIWMFTRPKPRLELERIGTAKAQERKWKSSRP